MMTASELVAKALDTVWNRRTLYVMGCFGAPMTAKNKTRYSNNNTYNKRPERTAMIQAASTDTFGFDCVGLIKGLLWGWSGDQSATYGGAKYESNDVPDISADTMISRCADVSSDFTAIVPGAVVWNSGHIGIYVGENKVVECSPSFQNCVQVTTCGNIEDGRLTDTSGRRLWTKWGKLPWVDYTVPEPEIVIDEDTPEWGREYLLRAIKLGLLEGCGDGTYKPNRPITRLEAVTIVLRAIDLLSDKNPQ